MTLAAKELNRLTHLRMREMRGEANADESAELAAILQGLDADEAAYLQPATMQQQQENNSKQAELELLETQNVALEALIAEQEQLVADAHSFLTELDKRHQRIHDSYAQLTGTPLAAA